MSTEASRRDTVAAWRENLDWRNDFLAEATRELSKHGELSFCHEYQDLATGLTVAEVVGMYERLLESNRSEVEWRDEFLALFPQVGPDDLPAPITDLDEEVRQMNLDREASSRRLGKPQPFIADEDIPF